MFDVKADKMEPILIVHGPNLNLLGDREPEQYGHDTLESITQGLDVIASQHHLAITHFQSNAEHELIEVIQRAPNLGCKIAIINPAAFTHTSVAIRDAIAGVSLPFIEVHLSNVSAREPFRQQSYFSDIAIGVISGFGRKSYEYALDYAIDYLQLNQQSD